MKCQQYLGSLISFVDKELWNKMSDILDRPIFIYSHKIYKNSTDHRNYDLSFQAKYGESKTKPVQRVFIIPGHYNALLRPDEVENFIKNIRKSEQGRPYFWDTN